MTSPEIVLAAAVGKALNSVGEKALGADEGQRKQLRELAKDSPALKAAAGNYAKRIAVKQAILLKLYQPLAKWMGISRDYFVDDFAMDMAEKVADIPDENVVAPPPSIAIPAMQGLAYSLEEPNLKNMYLNLLATASDNRRRDGAHPSFAEVIKQLTSREALLLTGVLAAQVVPIVRYKHEGERGYLIVQSHVMDLVDPETKAKLDDPAVAIYVDNWIRLGLVAVKYDEHITDESRYSWATERPEWARHSIEAAPDGMDLKWDKGLLRVTNFGKSFSSAVGTNKEEGAA